MNTSITSKLAALAVALTLNSAIMGGVLMMFNSASAHGAVALAAQPAARATTV